MTKPHFMVVGGTRGTGKALVRHLVDAGGYNVSVLGRSTSLGIVSPNLNHYVVDVTDREALFACLDQAVECFGKFVCVIFLQRHRSEKDEFEMDLAVAINATKNSIDHLVERQYFAEDALFKSIVLVSSIADNYIAPEQSAGYHVGKAGLVQLGRYYAYHLAPMGIRVNVVSPSVVLKDEAREFYANNKDIVDRYNMFIPLGRMGESKDIVNLIMFFAGEQASYITGQNMVIDGGLALRTHDSIIRDLPTEKSPSLESHMKAELKTVVSPNSSSKALPMQAIPWWRISIGEKEIVRVTQAIKSEHISQGPVVSEFENRLAEYLGVPYVVATTSGSMSILMACMAIGVGIGDEVIVPNRTWIATAHAPALLGAKVRLVDVHADRLTIDPSKIEEAITDRTKAIMPVHLNGRSADMREICRIAQKHGLKLIEDAAQALGSRNADGFLGTQSDMGCFSLSVAKIIATGQGGFTVTRDKALYEKLIAIRTHGVNFPRIAGQIV